MAYPPIVSRSTEGYTPGVVYADMSEVTTQQGTLVAGTYAYLQVLGRVTATGKLTAHNPAASDGSQVPVALAAYPQVAAADAAAVVITSGSFAVSALTFHASLTTDDAKIAAFPVGSRIRVKKTAFGA